jgi:hypothetical protein
MSYALTSVLAVWLVVAVCFGVAANRAVKARRDGGRGTGA